ncbi:helix-turn-helix transcriptional regulator [Muribaculum intestinale]|jgi:excisionase family DNA binding protein|uniref:DNA-binding protein n=1 Tax=Muribaculum intestinale TaxID=1796646 RepID=A0A4V3RU82_9BACT|nr:helix-turn-helix domain-containing protein [Muribaculum intestinale]MYM12799.1 helix-turn-helix domain-containing protein [Muribaculum intestinale]TGY73899.1 DNA-binding protein [Muribaculum intestinale]
MSIEQRLERIEALMSMSVTEVLTVKEVAILIKKSESRVRHMVADRDIPHYKNDKGQISFRKSEIEAWRLGQRVPTNAEVNSQAATHIAISRI